MLLLPDPLAVQVLNAAQHLDEADASVTLIVIATSQHCFQQLATCQQLSNQVYLNEDGHKHECISVLCYGL